MNWSKRLVLATAALAASLPAWGLDVHPTLVPTDDNSNGLGEVCNPGRGLYDRGNTFYNEDTFYTTGYRIFDSYRRYYWESIESGKDTWDFSSISDNIAKARSNNGKFGFRIMSLWGKSYRPEDLCAVPAYIADSSRNANDTYGQGTWGTNDKGNTYFWPAWNNSNFLTRVEAMSANLGKTFGGTYGGPSVNKNLGWVEVGIYGDTGEWHTCMRGDPTLIDDGAHAGRIIDSYVAAFPNTQILFRQGNRYCGLALDSAANIGIRGTDGIGWSWAYTELNTSRGYTAEDRNKALNRWKTAPVIGEHFQTNWGENDNTPKRSPDWASFGPIAIDQVATYHMSMVPNVTNSAWAQLNSAQQAQYRQMIKGLGYRFNLTHVTTNKDTVARGEALSITSNWTNTGNAPAYEDWDATWELRNPSTGAVVASVVSSLDLKTFLPGNAPAPVDNITVDGGVAAADYDLYLTIKNREQEANNRGKLRPAIKGLNSEGEYLVGTIKVD